MLAQVRKEYEMLRIEFEQQLAANEQTGPINREMRHLITSLQNHNLQLKGEIGRYKRKYREVAVDLSKVCGFLCFFFWYIRSFYEFHLADKFIIWLDLWVVSVQIQALLIELQVCNATVSNIVATGGEGGWKLIANIYHI